MHVLVFGDLKSTPWNERCGVCFTSRQRLDLHLSKQGSESMAHEVKNKHEEDRHPTPFVFVVTAAESILRLLQVSVWLRSG